MRRLRSDALGACPSAADATVPRLRIVPDVPMTRSKPASRDLMEVLADLRVDVAHQPALVARLERVGLDEPLGQPDDAQLEALAQLDRRSVPARDLDAAAADVDDDDGVPGHADAVDRRHMDEAGFFGAGDDPRPDAGLLGDGLEEFAAVLGFAGGARRDGDNFVDLVGFGQTPEFRQHLERGVHRLRGERPAIKAARTQPDHFLLPVDDLERQVGPDLHHDHVDGVGADVDGCDAHLLRLSAVSSQRSAAC